MLFRLCDLCELYELCRLCKLHKLYELCELYFKVNSDCENQIILLMIPNEEK